MTRVYCLPITEQEAKLAFELADFEVDRALFVDNLDSLDVQLLEQAAAAAFASWQAVVSQVPSRVPFARGETVL